MYKDKNGWTPLCEGLPNNNQECFVWYEDPIGLNGWCFSEYRNGSFEVSHVTHWRPVFKNPVMPDVKKL